MNLTDINEIFKNRKPIPMGPYRYYAVMVPLVKKGDDLFILYEVRAASLLKQPNEVCFPGGQKEKNETPQECAIRETCEELGLDRKDIQILAPLDCFHSYSHFTLYPFLGVIDYDAIQTMKINPDEVKDVFLVPLSFLMKNDPLIYIFDILPQENDDFPYEMINSKGGYNWRKGKNVIPIYQYEGQVIWGLTAQITCHFIEILQREHSE